VDAEAYDEFSKMMTPMCRFVKPLLSMIPGRIRRLSNRVILKQFALSDAALPKSFFRRALHA